MRTIIRSILLAGLGALSSMLFAEQYAQQELIVKFKTTSLAVERSVNQGIGAQTLDRSRKLGYVRVRLPQSVSMETALNYYRGKSQVKSVSKNPLPEILDTPNDPLLGQQWQIAKMKLPQAWDLNTGDAGTTIAILDTGCQMDHPDLASKYVAGYDPGENDNDPSDENGHGTHVAGIAAAATDNATGGAGTGRDCSIMPVKVFGSRGGIALVDGIIWATDRGAKVISMSLKIGDFQALRDAINYALSNGVFVVAAAGNDNATFKNYPAAYPGVMAVASSDPDDSRSGFSTYGDWVHVAAPGSGILSTVMGSGYGNNSGTSMACPGVAGVAGLIWSRGGLTITNTDVFNVITDNADPVGDYVIYGRVNAYESVRNTFVTVTAGLEPVEVGLYQGTDEDGDLSSLVAEDGNAFSLKTVIVPRFASAGGVTMKYVVDRPLSELVGMDLMIRMNSTFNSTGMLWLWNYNTEEYDFIKAWPVKKTYVTQSIPLDFDMSAYVNGSNEINALVRSHIPLNRAGGNRPFTVRYDMSGMEISFQQQP